MWNTPSKDKLSSIPRLYKTEHVDLKEKIIHLHFFLGGCDWYVSEYDGGDIFWGFVILNNDFQCSEWGYISLSELQSIRIQGYLEIDCDLYWEPKSAKEVERIRIGNRWHLLPENNTPNH